MFLEWGSEAPDVLRENMKKLGHITIFERPVYSSRGSNFAALIDFELPSSHSVILLVSDAIGVETEMIYSAVSKLVDKGVIYACTWGDDCERVHDIFDEVDVGDGSSDSDDFIMTTWHNDNSLEEAIEFFFDLRIPIGSACGHLFLDRDNRWQ